MWPLSVQKLSAGSSMGDCKASGGASSVASVRIVPMVPVLVMQVGVERQAQVSLQEFLFALAGGKC